jgi:hypothetical protein
MADKFGQSERGNFSLGRLHKLVRERRTAVSEMPLGVTRGQGAAPAGEETSAAP